MPLREPDHAPDLGLAEIAEIAKHDDAPLALVERAHGGGNHRMSYPLLVGGLLAVRSRVFLLHERQMRAGQRCEGHILLDAAWNPDDSAAVAEMPANLTFDADREVGGDLRDALGVAAIDGADQAERADLNEILEALPAAGEPPCDPPHQRKVSLDEPAPHSWVAQIGRAPARSIVHFGGHADPA